MDNDIKNIYTNVLSKGWRIKVIDTYDVGNYAVYEIIMCSPRSAMDLNQRAKYIRFQISGIGRYDNKIFKLLPVELVNARS